jgi:hypothetical protein
MTLQIRYAVAVARNWLDVLRWRLCWLLMPKIGLAHEKRRLEDIARNIGASRSIAHGIASAYFNALRDNR